MLRKSTGIFAVLAIGAITFVAFRSGKKPASPGASAAAAVESTSTARPPSPRAAVGVPRFTPGAPPPPAPVEADHDESPRMAEFKVKVTSLAKECMAKGDCNPRTLHVEEAALGFDYNLGADHPKRAQFLKVMEWSYDERQVLGQKFAAQEMNRRELFTKMREHLTEMQKRLGAVLSDQEYEKVLHIKKGVALNKQLDFSPELADKLDQEAKQQQEHPSAEPPPAEGG
jgi:hypothetical protein